MISDKNDWITAKPLPLFQIHATIMLIAYGVLYIDVNTCKSELEQYKSAAT